MFNRKYSHRNMMTVPQPQTRPIDTHVNKVLSSYQYSAQGYFPRTISRLNK